MADHPPLQSIPAPYIKNVASLVRLPHPSEKVTFLCAGAGAKSSREDIFSAGDFDLQEFQWQLKPAADMAIMASSAFDSIDSNTGLLVGYIGYESGFLFEHRWAQRLPFPSNGFAWRFMKVPCWYTADHVTGTGTIKFFDNCAAGSVRRLQDLIAQQQSCNNPEWDPLARAAEDLAIVSDLGELKQQQYESRVRQILEDIAAGRYYELNFTQRFRTTSNSAPADFFSNLFTELKPAHGFYCRLGDEAVCSFSPELYISKISDLVCTRPVKGSKIAGSPTAEWGKLHAEHVMVVDLARNDIGRVSDKAPVQVDEFMKTRHFGGLDHLESVVSGTTSLDWRDIIRRTFPAASITGAPKIEVVQATHFYEASPRHVYTGACGCIWPNGNVDLNVAIRTAWARQSAGKWHYEIGGGGAIVADSDPTAEYLECLRKVSPIINRLTAVNNSCETG